MERMANYSWGFAGGMFGILLIYVVIIGILLAAVVILEKGRREKMKIRFPRGIEIDINNVPENFDEIIRNAFEEYTALTNPKYCYQDKLAFIDRCAELLHRARDSHDAVKALIIDRAEFELDEYGDLPDRDEFWSMGFLEECYELGKKDMSLYSHYTRDNHVDDKIMMLLFRVIKVIINYEGE